MKTVGIIAEYNPFHTGHQFHMEESRRITGADGVLVIMSGNFVQRGAPAIADKYTRAQSAILGGADLVVELPALYATGSAEIFAMGAISILNKTNIVDSICFGAETDNISLLNEIAQILLEEPEKYRKVLRKELKIGANIPTARAKALEVYFNQADISSIIGTPNNILALEYLRAIKFFNSNITPYCILRQGASYHDVSLDMDFSSATALRECFNNEDFDKLADFMPDSVYNLYKEKYNISLPINTNNLNSILNYSLILNRNNLTDFLDVNDNLAGKIINYLESGQLMSFDDLCLHLKTKEITYTRISRGLLNIILGIKNDDLSNIKKASYPAYLRVLAFNEKGKTMLNTIKKQSMLPIITNVADGINQLVGINKKILNIDIFASDIYRILVKNRYNTTLKDEFRTKPYIL